MIAAKPLGPHSIPRGGKLHLAWRYYAYRRVQAEPRYREVFRAACRRSCLFYLNTFVWLNEPRAFQSTVPFATWDFQDDLVNQLVSRLRDSSQEQDPGKVYDVLIEKSRGMGVTWTCLAVMDWFWRFFPRVQFLAISEKELKVDRIGDPSALLPKLDWIEERVPAYLQVRGTRHDHFHGRMHLVVHNPMNGASITGESANPDAGRSGRYLGVLRDEEAAAPYGTEITNSLNATTRCQMRVSTPRGTGNSFYEARRKEGISVLTLHWSKHPYFARGLYEYDGSDVRILDGDWHAGYTAQFGRRYPFRRDATYADPGALWEKLRSPWFDAETQRSETVKGISQELQISYLGSGSPFFNPARLAEQRNRNAMFPRWKGNLDTLLKEPFTDADMRPERAICWFDVIGGRPPQKTTYTVACDISTGTGVSDSAVSVGDDRLKRKVFEFISNGILPEEFAGVVAQICRWFTTAEGRPFCAWDAGGPGQSFGVRFVELCPEVPVYWHRPAGSAKRARLPGVHFAGQGGKPKLDLFTAYRTALFGGWYATPSVRAYEQCAEYVFDRGLPTHVAATTSDTSEGQGEQHGDVVASEVVLQEAMSQRPQPRPVKPETPVGSWAWRQEQAVAEGKALAAWCGWN